MSEWISVSERLPGDKDYPVIIITADSDGYSYVNATFNFDSSLYYDPPITHWMPLPEPPHA
jgi:hypothetical protein